MMPRAGQAVAAVGEHTTEVFGEWLGMSAGDITGLRD
jgi:hypothetical protein